MTEFVRFLMSRYVRWALAQYARFQTQGDSRAAAVYFPPAQSIAYLMPPSGGGDLLIEHMIKIRVPASQRYRHLFAF